MFFRERFLKVAMISLVRAQPRVGCALIRVVLHMAARVAKSSVEAEAERRRNVSFAHSPQLLRMALLNTRYGNRVSRFFLASVEFAALLSRQLLSPASFSVSALPR